MSAKDFCPMLIPFKPLVNKILRTGPDAVSCRRPLKSGLNVRKDNILHGKGGRKLA